VTAQVPASTKSPDPLESAATVTPKRLVASVGPKELAGSPILPVVRPVTFDATASYTHRLPDVACGFAYVPGQAAVDPPPLAITFGVGAEASGKGNEICVTATSPDAEA
jgi:hypothetical protein